MQTASRNGTRLLTLLFALLWSCVTVTAQTASDASVIDTNSSTAISTTGNTAPALTHSERSNEARQTTCRPGTVNYITHSLPQQCLNRSSPTSNATSSSVPTIDLTSSSFAEEKSTIVTSSPNIQPASTAQPESELESDSPLDNANFLSFEEWKNQNLAKLGQSPDHVGQKTRSPQDKHPRNIPGINNALDVLGDDSEIELDFGGFGRQDSAPSSTSTSQLATASVSNLRSKDAGKTCKERSNYASFDCAATILKSNPESKSASAVLIENKDSYMLNICSSSNKFIIVELCNDILIDTIVLANYEFFSSIFRTFRVSVSDRYPVKPDRWRELGVFEARNTRSVQAFLVEHSLIWARYLRIEFLTHYGNEYYCPVSLLRVHGTTMMEDYRHQEELARGELSDDLEETVMPDGSESPAQEPIQSSMEADKSVVVESASHLTSSTKMQESPTAPSTTHQDTQSTPTSEASTPVDVETHSANINYSHEPAAINTTSGVVSDNTEISVSTTSTNLNLMTSATVQDEVPTELSRNLSLSATSTVLNASTSPSSSRKLSEDTPVVPTQSLSTTSISAIGSADTASDLSSGSNLTKSTSKEPLSSSILPNGTSISSRHASASDIQQKPGTSTSSAVQSNPTTQESFFKSIHKRLQMLETNATLSLQYIEEQSRILRDAFIKVEKRQIKKTEAFLDNLNTTVFAELQDFKQQYDQLWQSTVIELENHREQYQREILAVSARLGIVADELVFQKRMAIVQSTILMICLGLVLFVRVGGVAGLDVPIIQQMVTKSQFGRNSYYSPLNSPSPDQSSPPDPHSMKRRRGFWKSSMDTSASARPVSRGNENLSEGTIDEHPLNGNPDLRFEPPTPTREGNEVTDGEDGVIVPPAIQSMRGKESFVDEGLESGDDLGDPTLLPQETQSSPSTPSGSRDLKTLQPWPSTEEAPESDGLMPDGKQLI